MEAREPLAQAELTTELIERALPSGRKLVVRSASTGDEVEIRAANGELDLRITLTDAGPVVSLRGAPVPPLPAWGPHRGRLGVRLLRRRQRRRIRRHW